MERTRPVSNLLRSAIFAIEKIHLQTNALISRPIPRRFYETQRPSPLEPLSLAVIHELEAKVGEIGAV
jgi:hypothetical protein